MNTDHNHHEDIHHLERQRRENRDAAASLGLSPYGRRIDNLTPLATARTQYNPQADEQHKQDESTDNRPHVTVAGRVILRRPTGGIVWLNIRDDTADLQIAVSKKDCTRGVTDTPGGFEYAKSALDRGDIVVATGPLMKTKTGEISVWATGLEAASKCLVPPPEKHAGLKDVELRYRQRYMDMWDHPHTTRVFKLRSRLVTRIRRFLDERGYLEVETPVLQQLAGGAAARPFRTHMNALDIELFLRIAPELYLKRLLVGGMPRVYELSRNFRNEGLDRSHNPEFTSLELYQAFGDYHTMMETAESLVRELARVAVIERQETAYRAGEEETPAEENTIPDADALVLPFGDLNIDYGSPFTKITYADLFKQALGYPTTDTARAREDAKARGLKTTGKNGEQLDDILIVNELFERVAELSINPEKPTFVTDYPAALSPLTRPKKDNPAVAERWDLFIGGMEIGPAYTELNDPDIQAAKFKEQLAGIDDDEQTFRTFDEDFIQALKVGMPPAGGLGLGIERLIMLLANQTTIRDVMLFPMMRPLAQQENKPKQH